MTTFERVDSEASCTAAKALMTEYGDFLRLTQSCGFFNFAKYQEEIATLPAPYTHHNGDVLLAYVDGTPTACIAYREAMHDAPPVLRDQSVCSHVPKHVGWASDVGW